MNLVLIGFMGSGKSTVASALSRLLGMVWVEMDELVYQRTGTQDMPEVFAKGGEILLRETEIAIAKEYASKKNWILSSGGGVVLNKIVIDYLKSAGGKVIFLHTRFEQIVQRLEGDDSRPLWRDLRSVKQLYDFRLPLYFQYADEVLDVEFQSAETLALEIQKRVL